MSEVVIDKRIIGVLAQNLFIFLHRLFPVSQEEGDHSQAHVILVSWIGLLLQLEGLCRFLQLSRRLEVIARLDSESLPLAHPLA